MNSKEENSSEFCLNFVQEFSLRFRSSSRYKMIIPCFLYTIVQYIWSTEVQSPCSVELELELKRACHTQVLSSNVQLQAIVNCSCICLLHDAMEITNAKLCQKSVENSVVWRAAECHCRAARFLLHISLKIISKFKYIIKQR